jgi:hypothetical protein
MQRDTLPRAPIILKHIGMFINIIMYKLYINIKHLKIIHYKHSLDPNNSWLLSDAQ